MLPNYKETTHMTEIWERKYNEQLSIKNKLEDGKFLNKIKKIIKRNRYLYKTSVKIYNLIKK